MSDISNRKWVPLQLLIMCGLIIMFSGQNSLPCYVGNEVKLHPGPETIIQVRGFIMYSMTMRAYHAD
jgi:hypothetical protein